MIALKPLPQYFTPEKIERVKRRLRRHTCTLLRASAAR